MELNKYLRIKKAYNVPLFEAVEHNGLPAIYTNSATPSDVIDILSALHVDNDPYSNFKNITEQDVNNTLKRRRIYHALTRNVPTLANDAEIIPTYGKTVAMLKASLDDNDRLIYSRDPKDNYVLVHPNALMTDILHEQGHKWLHNQGADLASGSAATQLAKTWGGRTIYDPRLLEETLTDERTATNYARAIVNNITDPALRNRMLQEVDDNLENAYKTYDVKYGNPLRAHKFGRNVAGALGGTVGGIGLGYLGYRGGDALAKWLKWKKNGLGHNLLRYGGMLGLGALGGYGGYRLGKKYLGDKFGTAGQWAYQTYNNATQHEAKKLNELYANSRAAYSKHSGNVDRLDDYVRNTR